MDDTCSYTTAMLDLVLSQKDAERALSRLGLDLSDTDGVNLDYRRLLFALDVLFVNGYGTSALAGFLESPHQRLQWRRPAEVVREPGGVDRVRTVIGEIVAARRERHPVVA